MFSSLIASVALLSSAALATKITTGALGNATITTDNLEGASYQAVLPELNTTNFRGQITGTSNSNGTGVHFNINFYGFPDEDTNGPFLYHIHAFPVPSDGNCTSTLAHLDPYERGETPVCDPVQPETCEVGDLAGKHGNITTNPFQSTYLELYTTTLEGPGAFFGNRSIVIHNQNLTRLTCANFTLAHAATASASATGSSSSSSTTPVYKGAAVAAAAGADMSTGLLMGAAGVLGLMAMIL